MNLQDLTLRELRAGLDRREFSSSDATRACLERIAATEPQLNAFITVCEAQSAGRRPKPPTGGWPPGVRHR